MVVALGEGVVGVRLGSVWWGLSQEVVFVCFGRSEVVLEVVEVECCLGSVGALGEGAVGERPVWGDPSGEEEGLMFRLIPWPRSESRGFSILKVWVVLFLFWCGVLFFWSFAFSYFLLFDLSKWSYQ